MLLYAFSKERVSFGDNLFHVENCKAPSQKVHMYADFHVFVAPARQSATLG